MNHDRLIADAFTAHRLIPTGLWAGAHPDDGWTAACACGANLNGATLQAARIAHTHHRGAAVRAAIGRTP